MRTGKFHKTLKDNKRMHRAFRKYVVFISGGVTGVKDYKKIFERAEAELIAKGYAVINPTKLPLGMEYMSYMRICRQMIKEADYFYSIPGWRKSVGAIKERNFARLNKKIILSNIE